MKNNYNFLLRFAWLLEIKNSAAAICDRFVAAPNQVASF